MKWRKLGRIFNPTEHELPAHCVEYAQSPQPLVFDDFVRIYFSTRERDATGKFLSHIAYVDMDKKFENILAVSRHEVIALGGLGCFDEHGIFPISPVHDGDQILAYTTGWNRKVSVSADASIGLAISKDGGSTFNKVGTGPVLTSSLHEPFLVADAFVLPVDGQYHMWYIYGTSWNENANGDPPDRVYKIGHARSDDGVIWNKTGRQLIADRLNENECQALPTVVQFNGRYHMYFCYRQSVNFRRDSKSGYRIGYAYSDDMEVWTRDDENAGIDVSEGDWDSDMMAYPFVFKCDDQLYLLYNGNEFGRFGFGLAVLEH